MIYCLLDFMQCENYYLGSNTETERHKTADTGGDIQEMATFSIESAILNAGKLSRTVAEHADLSAMRVAAESKTYVCSGQYVAAPGYRIVLQKHNESLW